ncbi:3-dehydrosphinganine reductase TSC10A-like protein [Tanacetum coccineum]
MKRSQEEEYVFADVKCTDMVRLGKLRLELEEILKFLTQGNLPCVAIVFEVPISATSEAKKEEIRKRAIEFMLIVAANSVGEELFYHAVVQGALADVLVRGSDLVANAHRMAAPTGGAETDHAGSQQQGARVTILARNLKNLEESKTSIRLSTGIDVNIVSADVRDFEAVKEAFVSMGPIDVLVCNQGVFVSQELEKQEINEVKDMIDVNLVETFNVVKAALPGMKNRSDRKPVSIVFMSSQAGQARKLGGIEPKRNPYSSSRKTQGDQILLELQVLQSNQVMDNSEFYTYRPKLMTGVPRQIVEHKLNVRKGCQPVRQKKRGQAAERNVAINDEVSKLMKTGIIR